MRKLSILLAVAMGLTAPLEFFEPSEAAAAPVSVAPLAGALDNDSLVQEARWFCYNRNTGRFLHWGKCGRRRVVRRRVPRVYCYNRITGRFLHWGHC